MQTCILADRDHSLVSRRLGEVPINIYAYAVISAICFATFNAMTKLLPSRIHIIYILPFVIAGAVVTCALSLLLPQFMSYGRMELTRTGAAYAALMGSIWASGQIVFLHMFFKYSDLSLVVPILVGAVALMGVALGFVVFREPLSVYKVIGVVTILAGVIVMTRG